MVPLIKESLFTDVSLGVAYRVVSDIIENKLLLKLLRSSSLAFSKIFTFFKWEFFSDDFLPLFKLPNISNKSFSSLSAFSIVYISHKNIEGNETLLKS